MTAAKVERGTVLLTGNRPVDRVTFLGLAQIGKSCSNLPMRNGCRVLWIPIAGAYLGLSSQTFADSSILNTGAEPAVKSNHASTSAATAPGPSGFVGTNQQPAEQEKTGSLPSDSSSKAAGVSAGKGTGSGAGYTWNDKKRKVGGKRPSSESRARAVDLSRPLAAAPNFEMRADGTSAVTLMLSHAVELRRVTGARGAESPLIAEFVLENAQIGVKNNTNPLVTDHFPTPLLRVVMRRHKQGAILRLEFREAVHVSPSTKPGPAGSSLVEIVVPKPTRVYAVIATARPKSGSETKVRGRVRKNDEVPTEDLDAPGPRP